MGTSPRSPPRRRVPPRPGRPPRVSATPRQPVASGSAPRRLPARRSTSSCWPLACLFIALVAAPTAARADNAEEAGPPASPISGHRTIAWLRSLRRRSPRAAAATSKPPSASANRSGPAAAGDDRRKSRLRLEADGSRAVAHRAPRRTRWSRAGSTRRDHARRVIGANREHPGHAHTAITFLRTPLHTVAVPARFVLFFPVLGRLAEVGDEACRGSGVVGIAIPGL